jgi:hypothetical protein
MGGKKYLPIMKLKIAWGLRKDISAAKLPAICKIEKAAKKKQ